MPEKGGGRRNARGATQAEPQKDGPRAGNCGATQQSGRTQATRRRAKVGGMEGGNAHEEGEDGGRESAARELRRAPQLASLEAKQDRERVEGSSWQANMHSN